MNNSIAIALDQHDKQKEALAAWHGLSMSILSAANVAVRRCLRGDDWCI
jgi:methylglyoxal synthase